MASEEPTRCMRCKRILRAELSVRRKHGRTCWKKKKHDEMKRAKDVFE